MDDVLGVALVVSKTSLSLLRSAAIAAFQLFLPALFLSFSTVFLQVVFCLCLSFRPSGFHPNAMTRSITPLRLYESC